MEPQSDLFASVLQGPYAYLLIVQVLIVTGLLLAFIWLLLYRTREAAMAAPAQAQPVAPVEAPPAPTVPVVDAAELESEKQKSAGLERDTNLLRDKVQYLESKLLQYEILQEEISSLSQLKQDNETLRQELMKLKGGGGATTAPAAATAAPVAAAAPTPTSDEPKEPTAMAAGGLSSESPESLDSLLQQIDQLTTQPPKS